MPQSASRTHLAQSDLNEEGGLELGQVIAALQRRLLLIIGITTVVVSAAVLKALTETPIYQSQFEILTEPVTVEAEVISSIPDTLGSNQRVPRNALDETKLRILRSPSVINPIVEELKSRYPQITYGFLVSSLNISPIGKDARILGISYQDEDPQRVEAVLSEVSEAFLRYSLESRQSNIQRGLTFVEGQLPDLESRVQELETQLQRFRQQYGIVDPNTQGQELASQLSSFSGERLSTQIALTEAQALYSDLQNQLSSQPDETAASSALSNSARYQDLLNQLLVIDKTISEQATVLLDTSPDLQLLQESRQNLIPLLEREGARVQEEVASRIRELQARNQILSQVVEDLNLRLKQFPELSREYTAIQRQLQIANDNLNQFLTKREALRIDAAQREVPWQILTPPGRPRPSSANLKANLVLGTALGLLLGIAAALVLEKLGGVLYSSKEIKSITNFPLLGVIPFNQILETSRIPINFSSVMQQADATAEVEQSAVQPSASIAFFEAFRLLYTSLRFVGAGAAQHSITISSAAPGDGKSTVALYLAQAASAMGQRVLLVDGDLRRPVLQDRLGLDNTQGLVDIVTHHLNPKDIIQKSSLDENLFILTAGTVPPDPTRILSSKTFQEVHEQLQDLFDLVIYDTPPLVGLADPYLITAHTGGLLMVIGLSKVKRSQLEKAVEELRVSGVPILGTVANGAKEEVGTYAGYYS